MDPSQPCDAQDRLAMPAKACVLAKTIAKTMGKPKTKKVKVTVEEVLLTPWENKKQLKNKSQRSRENRITENANRAPSICLIFYLFLRFFVSPWFWQYFLNNASFLLFVLFSQCFSNTFARSRRFPNKSQQFSY